MCGIVASKSISWFRFAASWLRNRFHGLDVRHRGFEIDFMVWMGGIVASKSISWFGWAASWLRNRFHGLDGRHRGFEIDFMVWMGGIVTSKSISWFRCAAPYRNSGDSDARGTAAHQSVSRL